MRPPGRLPEAGGTSEPQRLWKRSAVERWAKKTLPLSEAIFDCVGQGASPNGGAFRHFACTYDFGGKSVDQSGRVEIVTTGRDAFRVASFG